MTTKQKTAVRAVLARVKNGVIAGDVELNHLALDKLPDLSGVVVTGHFDCNYNQLTSLVGAPTAVGGYFHCHANDLTDLVGAPISVGGNFYCYFNHLTSLTGAPTSVGGEFSHNANPVRGNESSADEKVLRRLAASKSVQEDLSGLPDPGSTARTLALDFVEQRLGQFHAHDNWAKLGPEAPKWVRLWLEAAGYSADLAPQVVEELQKLFSTRQAWPTGFDL